MTLSSRQIKEKVAQFCAKEPAVVAAYLFGSYAKDRQKASSDIDIAVLLDDKHPFALLEFISVLEIATGCSVDTVILNNTGEVLKHQIRRDGILVFERSPMARKRFEIKSRKFFEDFLYLHRKYVNKVLYRENNGRPGSH